MEKTDIKKSLRNLYGAPNGHFVAIDVPAMQFVKVDGQGDPNCEASYSRAVTWLYSVSYAIKFAVKAQLGKDYVVPPLEGLWWADDPRDFVERRKERWCWTMMIMAPDFVRRSHFDAASAKVHRKLGDPPLMSLRFEALREGRCLQTLHVGSYDAEGPILAKLHHEIMPSMGLTFAGPHHEIYLSDPRKTPRDRLKTVLRQPVRPL